MPSFKNRSGREFTPISQIGKGSLTIPGMARFGVGFRAEFAETVLEEKPSVDWFEIITENFMFFDGVPRKRLEKLRSLYPIATHGVSLSIGSVDPLRGSYLEKLKEFVDWLQPEWVTDHLCFTRRNEHNSHDLLPIPLYQTVLDEIVRRVDQVQSLLRRPILLENPSLYVALPNAEYSEAQFFNELCTRSGCGMLLDLNNLEVNEINLGVNAEEYLKTIKPGHVKQFHIAGHSIEGNQRIDTHDHPVSGRTWEIYRSALVKWPNVSLILERDAQIPPFQVLHEELKQAIYTRNQVLESIDQHPSIDDAPTVLKTIQAGRTATPEVWNNDEEKFFNSVIAPSEGEIFPGLKIYQNAYLVRAKETLQNLFPSLYFIAEEEGFWKLSKAYLKAFPPIGDSVDDLGNEFEGFLRSNPCVEFDFGVPLSQLADLVAVEKIESDLMVQPESQSRLQLSDLKDFSVDDWERARFLFQRTSKVKTLPSDAWTVIQKIRQGEVPAPPESGSFSAWVYVENDHVHTEPLTPDEADCMKQLHWGVPLSQICHLLEGRLTPDQVIGKCVTAIQKGLVEKCFQKDLEEIEEA